MVPEISKTNRRQGNGFKAFADQFRTFGGVHYVCLDCDLLDETIADWRTRLKAIGIKARKVGNAVYVRHDQVDAADELVRR